MITINLPNREAFDALPDVFFWPVPTVPSPHKFRYRMSVDWNFGGPDYRHICECGEPKPDHIDVPDPEWVKAGEPCPYSHCTECGRSYQIGGRSETVIFTDEGFRHSVCDDRWDECCLNGKPRIAVTVPCECACHRGIMARTTAHHDCPCSVEMIAPSGYEQPGETPDVHVRVNSHRVTVGQAVIEHGPGYILAISAFGDVIDGQYAAFVGPGIDDWWPIGNPDDPASLVGTWGVACRKVQS